MRILMVEDEKYTALAVEEVLKKHNYIVDLLFDGENASDYALTGIYDIIILDIMLPKKDGLSILKEIRQAGLDVPVILLTAKGQIDDKVLGLDSGADDYLPKPYHTEELLARLRALNRRKPVLLNDGKLVFGDIELSPYDLLLSCGDKRIKLMPKQSQILEMLINSPCRVLSKNLIIEKVWGYDTEAEDNNVETHVSRLRKALIKIHSLTKIHTIRGLGYSLSADNKEEQFE
jgi:DNA-binding response OmpR family regulator